MAIIIRSKKSNATKATKTTTTTSSTRRTLGSNRMSKSNNVEKARISLWNTNSDNDKAPIARGTIQLTQEVVEELAEMLENGETEFTLGVSLWESDSDNEKAPAFTGLVQSPTERQAAIDAAKSVNSNKKQSRTRKGR